jgi:hypothetical protein
MKRSEGKVAGVVVVVGCIAVGRVYIYICECVCVRERVESSVARGK